MTKSGIKALIAAAALSAGAFVPYHAGHGSCAPRQWVWTPYGWRLEWTDVCGYGW